MIYYFILSLQTLLRCCKVFSWVIFEMGQGKVCPGGWGCEMWRWRRVGQVEVVYIKLTVGVPSAHSPLTTHHRLLSLVVAMEKTIVLNCLINITGVAN